MDGFDVRELQKLERDILDTAQKHLPKETKKFLRGEGSKLLHVSQSEAIFSGVKHNSHKYYDSIKRGKAYRYKGTGDLAIRVYSSAPHGHLIEDGHRQVTKDGREVGFVRGKHVFKDAAKQFEPTHYENTQKFIDDVLEKGW